MSKKKENIIIIELVEKMAGKKIDSKIVSESLELICENFSFDSGMVYETDQNNCYHLKEYHNKSETQLCDTFAIEEISPEYRSYLIKKTLVFISKDQNPAVHEQSLLHTFFTDSLLIASVEDENTRIFGFIIFSNLNKKVITEDELKTLNIILPLFCRYMGTRMYQNKLSFAQASLESILDNTGIDIYVNDFYTHDILYVNKSMAEPYGGVSDFMKHKCWQVLFPAQNGQCEFCPQNKLVDEQENPTNVYSWDYQRAFDGSWFRVFSAAFRWIDGRLAHVVSSANITENKHNEELVQYMANYDSLTGLPNRRMLVGECKRRIANAKEDTRGYLLFFDIDGFKAINDTLGHDAGDEFLIQLGAFFSNIPMLNNSIYRNGGDEFVAILDDKTTEENISYLANFIHRRFKDSWNLKKGPIFCTTSIGAACYPDDGTTAEELLKKADQAMYRVKNSGGGGLSFSKENE